MLGGRRKKADTNVTVVTFDTETLEVEIISDETSGNVDIDSSSDTATEEYISFPGSWFQYSISRNILFIGEPYPFSNILSPCSLSDGIQFSYLFGGYDNETFETSNIVQLYDESNNTWFEMPPMQEDRLFHGCTIKNDILYVYGGCQGTRDCTTSMNNYLTSIEYLDLNDINSGWNYLEPTLTIPRILARTVIPHASRNMIWFIGGYNPENGTLNSIEIYDENVDNVLFGPSLILSRASAQVTVTEANSGQTCLYILGGYYSPFPNSIVDFVSFDNVTILDNFEYLCFVDYTTGAPTSSPVLIPSPFPTTRQPTTREPTTREPTPIGR